MQTLSSGWTGPLAVAEKVSIVDHRIQLTPDGSSKVVHVDQLWLDPCHQDRTNWIRDKLARRADERLANKGTDPLRPRMATVGVSIACKTSDTDPIIAPSNNSAPKVTVRRVRGENGGPFVWSIIYRSRTSQS